MAFKWSAVESFEMHNTRREWFDSDGRFFASVTLQVEWEDRFKLVQDLYTSVFGDVPPAGPTGYNPRAYPDPGGDSGAPRPIPAPVMSKIGVTSATFRSWEECGSPKDANNQVFDYKSSAFVEVQYGRHFNIEETIDFDVEVITQSYLDFRWKTESYPNDQGYIHELEVPTTTLYSSILTRDFIGLAPVASSSAPLRPDLATLMECVGKVNVGPYTSLQLGKTFEAGTLLMLEPELRPSLDMQNSSASNLYGSQGFSAKLKFLYKEGGDPQLGEDVDTHNLFWRPAKVQGAALNFFHGAWDRLKVPRPGTTKGEWDLYRPFKTNSLINDNWLIDGEPPLPVN
jgi:hypothetical protein